MLRSLAVWIEEKHAIFHDKLVKKTAAVEQSLQHRGKQSEKEWERKS